MADRALLAGYPRYMRPEFGHHCPSRCPSTLPSLAIRGHSYGENGAKWHVTLHNYIWVRSRRGGCLVTWFCYQLIAKPGNKTAAPSWPDPYLDNPIEIWIEKICPAVSVICILQSLDHTGERLDKVLAHGQVHMGQMNIKVHNWGLDNSIELQRKTSNGLRDMHCAKSGPAFNPSAHLKAAHNTPPTQRSALCRLPNGVYKLQ